MIRGNGIGVPFESVVVVVMVVAVVRVVYWDRVVGMN